MFGSFFVNHELQIATTGTLHLETEFFGICFWWRSSVLFGQWPWSRTAPIEDFIFTPKCPTMELSDIIFAEIPPCTFTPLAVITLPIFCFVLFPLALFELLALLVGLAI